MRQDRYTLTSAPQEMQFINCGQGPYSHCQTARASIFWWHPTNLLCWSTHVKVMCSGAIARFVHARASQQLLQDVHAVG